MAGKRGHGEGTITKRPDGRWMAQITIGRDPATGKLKRLTKYFKTRQEAQVWLTEVQHQKNTGNFVEPDRVTFGDWLKRWLKIYVQPKVRPTSYANYHDVVTLHILPAIGEIPVQVLRTSTIQELYNQKAETLSPWMIHRMHILINRCLKQAVRERLIHSNPAESTVRPSIKRKEITVLAPEEMTRYLEAAREHRLYTAFLLECTSGLRRGELLALSWDCVDFTSGTVEVKRSLSRVRLVDEGRTELHFGEPKTESGKRTIPLAPDVLKELKEHRKRQAQEKLFFGQAYQDNGLVFATEDGRPVDPRSFHRWHTAILKKANLPHVRIHDLRHSFASILADAGEDPETLRALLGHSRTSTTMDLYCHASEKGKRRAVNRLAQIIKS